MTRASQTIPQTTRMLLKRPSLRQTGLALHLINNNSISTDNWDLVYYSCLKFALLLNSDCLRRLIKLFPTSQRVAYIWDIRWPSTLWLFASQEAEGATNASLSWLRRGHRQLEGASLVTETQDPQHSLCLTTNKGRVQSACHCPGYWGRLSQCNVTLACEELCWWHSE